MSNFLIGSGQTGFIAPALSEIDLSASPTQGDLDIDMSGFDELEVWFNEVDMNATTAAEAYLTTDGFSTVESTSGDYFGGNQGVGSVATATATGFPWGTSASALTDQINISGHYRFVGFNQTNNSVHCLSSRMFERLTSDVVGFQSFSGIANNCNGLRLGTLANFGTSGTIYYRKVAWASSAENTAVDYSVDTSSTTYIPVDGYDFTYMALNGVYNSGTGTRLMARISDDGTTVESGSIYIDQSVGQANAAQPVSYFNWSLDNTSQKYAQFAIYGPDEGASHLVPIWGGDGPGTYNLPKMGHIDHTAAVTDVIFSSWLDGQNYNAGTVKGIKGTANAWVATSGSTASSGTTLIDMDVDGYDSCIFVTDYGDYFTADTKLLVDFSVDGGSNWISSGYQYQSLDDGRQTSASTWCTGIYAGAAANFTRMEFYGLASGLYPVYYSASDWVGTGGSEAFGVHWSETSAVTNIRVRLNAGALDTSHGYTYHKWNWE